MEKDYDDGQSGERVNTEENYDNLKTAGGKKRKGKKKNRGAEIKPRASFHANEFTSSPKKEETISEEAQRKTSETGEKGDQHNQNEEQEKKIAEVVQDKQTEESEAKKGDEQVIKTEESTKVNEQIAADNNLNKNEDLNLGEANGDDKVENSADEKMGTESSKDDMTNNDITTEHHEQTHNENNTVENINNPSEHVENSTIKQEEEIVETETPTLEEEKGHSLKSGSNSRKVSENKNEQHSATKEVVAEVEHKETSPEEMRHRLPSTDLKDKVEIVSTPVKETRQNTEEITQTPHEVEINTVNNDASVKEFVSPVKQVQEEKTQNVHPESPKKESTTLANPQEEDVKPIEISSPKKEADLANPHIEEEITIKSAGEGISHTETTNTVQSSELPQSSLTNLKIEQTTSDKKQSSASDKFNGVNNNFSEDKKKLNFTDSMKMVDKIDIEKEKDQNLIDLRKQNTSEDAKKDKDRGFCTKCLIF